MLGPGAVLEETLGPKDRDSGVRAAVEQSWMTLAGRLMHGRDRCTQRGSDFEPPIAERLATEPAHRAGRLAFQLPHQAPNGGRFVRDRPRHRVLASPINIAIKRSFLCASTPTYVVTSFMTGSFRLRLWRPKALTRDRGGIHHLVECDSTTTLR